MLFIFRPPVGIFRLVSLGFDSLISSSSVVPSLAQDTDNRLQVIRVMSMGRLGYLMPLVPLVLTGQFTGEQQWNEDRYYCRPTIASRIAPS